MQEAASVLPWTPVWHHINLSLIMPSNVACPTCSLYRGGAKVCPVQYRLSRGWDLLRAHLTLSPHAVMNKVIE
jgi:hypothetical protein